MERNKRAWLMVCGVAATATGTCLAQMPHTVTFENGYSGWSISGRTSVDQSGNPSACLGEFLDDVWSMDIRTDEAGADVDPFLGDLSRYGSLRVSVDVRMDGIFNFFGGRIGREHMYGRSAVVTQGLKARQKAVEDLQTDRNVPVYLLDELVKQTPEGVYLTSIRQNGQIVSLSGVAQTNERVSEFLRNTLYNSTWLEKPELVEIKTSSTTNARDQRRLYDFSLRVTIKRQQATAAVPPPGIPASGAAPAAAPAKSS